MRVCDFKKLFEILKSGSHPGHHLGHISVIDPFPDLLHYRLFPCHGGHFGGHNCIGAFG